MSDNALQTLQHVIQDVLAPDVRELKVRVSSLEKQMDTQYNSLREQMDTQYTSVREQMETQYNSVRDQMDGNFKAVMSAIGESKARNELDTYKLITALTERVAALESARQ